MNCQNPCSKLLREYNKIFKEKEYILGRIACLGQTIFRNKYYTQNVKLINQQKARVDFLIEKLKGGSGPKSDLVEFHLEREDIHPLIVEQQEFPWNFVTNPNLIIMDSFSELTDQRFRHRNEGWSFYCNYTDIHHCIEFDNEFECLGLLDLDNLEELYLEFFNILRKKYPSKRLIFIHFPIELDSREKFKTRGREILRIMTNIAKLNSWITNLYISPDEVYTSDVGDNFPYHYGSKTYESFCKKWPKC
jgi:hypothetical protein